MECYKSSAHLECSEIFYKQCIQEELKTYQGDPELKKKTLDILQRIHNQDGDDDLLSELMHEDEDEENLELDGEEEDLDSDDENVSLFNN